MLGLITISIALIEFSHSTNPIFNLRRLTAAAAVDGDSTLELHPAIELAMISIAVVRDRSTLAPHAVGRPKNSVPSKTKQAGFPKGSRT